jgi:succinyl-CoA synthetase beta subunit
MTRLHEHQGKQILAASGILIPRGSVAHTAEQARAVAVEIGGPVIIKAQAWVTSRAAKQLVHFADQSDEVEAIAAQLLSQQVGNFAIEAVLVEEKVQVEREMYLGLIVDDSARSPVIIFSSVGGSGIEEIAAREPGRVARFPVDIQTGLREFEARDLARQAGIDGPLLLKLALVMVSFYRAARTYEARSAEINPLALTADGKLLALDCRFTVDDYAVYRHPDLGIEVAREFDHPPTPLEKIAWQVEKDDYRGTFYFIQMEKGFHKADSVIGFHGNGGGGSMMNMDALAARGFRFANFVDTSGNPPASKVYRAARIILSQPGIDGYYAGGSGVASQEQYHSARGLVKAFMDVQLNIPAVIRIGGNAEDQAIEILHRANGAFPAPVEAYGRNDSPDFCAERLQSLIESYIPLDEIPVRDTFSPQDPYSFETVTGGTVTYDHARCRDCASKICIETCAPKILSLDGDVPVLNISHEAARRGGCTECLACEVECYFLGNRGGRITLPIQGLEQYGNPD